MFRDEVKTELKEADFKLTSDSGLMITNVNCVTMTQEKA